MLEIIQAKDGSMTLRKNGVFLLSAYKPASDAAKYIDSQSLDYHKIYFVVFGSALGYLTKALENRGVESIDIAVFEPEEKLYLELKKNNPGYYLLNENSDFSDILEHKIKQKKKPYILGLETIKKAYSKEFEMFQAYYGSQVRKATENIKVSSYFSKVWFINYYRNLARTAINPDTYYMNTGYEKIDYPVVVAAAGPSLNKAISEIKKYRENLILISVLSAARTVIQAGIEPDLVVISDAGAANILHAAELPHHIPLFASVYANSALTEKLSNPVVFYDLERETENPSFELEYPSVSIDAGMLAKELFRGPLVFCGLDLAYSLTRGSHSAGNALSELRPLSFNRLSPVYSSISGFLRRRDIEVLPGPEDSLFTHEQFRMVQGLISRLLPPDQIYHFPGGLKFENMTELNDFGKIASHSDKESVIQSLKNNWLSAKELEDKVCRILRKFKNSLDEIQDKVFIREILSGTNLKQSEAYYRKKLSGLYHNLSIEVPR